jgi:hypothetical protein
VGSAIFYGVLKLIRNMEKIIHICDICEKEVDKFVMVEILIGDKKKWNYADVSSRYQNRSTLLICDDCIGSEIHRYNGKIQRHDRTFYIKDKGKNLLKMLKIIT